MEETIDDGSTPVLKTYTIGDDILSQATDSGSAQHLLYDGHGSTRQLVNSSAAVVDAYSYDAYGVMLGGNPTAANPATTNLLYCGEYYDNNLTQYNLRARWYDSTTGRFNRIDPFPGNTQAPQSLHKYLYCHANPVNNLDSGGQQTTFAEVIHIAAIGLKIFTALMLAYNVGRIIYLTATEQMTIDRAMWEIAKMGMEMAAWWVGGWLIGKIIQFGSVPLSKLPQIFQRVNRNRIVGKWAERVWGAAKGLQPNRTIINGTKPDFIQGNTLHELKYYVKSKITLSPQLEHMTSAGRPVVLHITPVTKVAENVKKAIELTGGAIVRDLPLLEFEALAAAGYITDRSFEESDPEDYWP